MRRFILIGLCLVATITFSQTQPQLNLMPMPSSVQQTTGQLPITSSFSVAVAGTRDPALEAGVQRFTKQLSAQTGIPFRTNTGATPTLTVRECPP